MPVETSRTHRLRSIIEAKRLVRCGSNNAYRKLEEYEKTIKRLQKEKKDTGSIELRKAALEEELEILEKRIDNTQFGTNIEAGGGLSGGSTAGGD
jgi:hypothetical protein